MDGILNINKPRNWTSFRVVKLVRRIVDQRRVGHTGTLDPIATGVLVVCIGKATKLVRFLVNHDKEYLLTIRLGISTDTQDATGRIIKETYKIDCKQEDILRVCSMFRGKIMQRPPMFSALKYQGEKLYKLARDNKSVLLPNRLIEIKELEIVELDIPVIRLRVVCSKGAYMRTLAADIGTELGCGAHLSELERIRVGNFHIDDAITPVELEELYLSSRIEQIIVPIKNALPNFSQLEVLSTSQNRIIHGGQIFQSDVVKQHSGDEGLPYVKVLSVDGDLLCIAKLVNGKNAHTLKHTDIDKVIAKPVCVVYSDYVN